VEPPPDPFEDLVGSLRADVAAEKRRLERLVILVAQVAAMLKDRGDLAEEGVRVFLRPWVILSKKATRRV